MSKTLPSLLTHYSNPINPVNTQPQVGNVNLFTQADWESDIKLAQASKIDGFVLNIAPVDPSTIPSVELAFKAAESLNFLLFFSFDYLAQGPWSADKVTSLLQKHTPSAAYFKPESPGGRPLVSTFEGPGNAGDWPAIKAATNAFFVPDWASKPPAEAVTLGGGVVDGLFSFNAWPNGDANMTVDGDKAAQAALAAKKGVYMMPVSPWFFTNLPGFGGKNWLWRGDELWEMRWQQVMEVAPEFVQILTWNDYGESHYIGPVNEKELGLFDSGKAPVNYAKGTSHDGWRKFLPFYIELYKTGKVPAQIEEGVMAYYRPAPALACPSGGTSGNDADHGQVEVPPEQLMEDSVFYAALLSSDKGVTVTVSIGGKEQTGAFNGPPAAGAGTPGVYRGSVPFGGNTGPVVVTVSRDGKAIGTAEGGKDISATCENNVQNWNAVAV